MRWSAGSSSAWTSASCSPTHVFAVRVSRGVTVSSNKWADNIRYIVKKYLLQAGRSDCGIEL